LQSGHAQAGVRSGGALDASRLDPTCSGFITDSPTLVVTYSGREDLYLSAGADVDTTLAVRTPGGAIVCDDDSAGGLNPGVLLSKAQPGAYEVWLGTYGAGMGYPAASLHASTTGFQTGNAFTQAPNPALQAEQSLRLRSGFRNDPRTLQVTAGGEARLEPLDFQCAGYADQAADVALDYRAGQWPLFIAMDSDRDGTLAVRTPSGEVLCNDDAVGLNPGVHVEAPETGEYLIWAGLLSGPGETASGTLSLSEVGYNGVDSRLDLTAQALFGERRLAAGFLPDPEVFTVQAGGEIDANMAVDTTHLISGYCAGYITRTPSIEIGYDAAGGPLYISAASEVDTTLVVNGPDGAWYCDDDSGQGSNPMLEFQSAESGVYDVFIGVFSEQNEGADATVFVSEIGGGADPINGRVDLSLPALYGDVALSAGFTPDPYVIDVEAGGPLDADQSGVDSASDYCAGNITAAPSVELDWSGQGGRLSLYVDSRIDTTLAVNLPDGRWLCDDDGGEGLNPAMEIQNAGSGVYDIYVGAFSDTQGSAQLNISEFRAPLD